MLTIKDFKPGDKVYVVTENFGRNANPSICERIVKTVGRMYVTLEGNWEEKFACDNQEYLREKKDWGEHSLLFQTEQKAKDYLEKRNLETWLLRQSSREIDNLSLEQLHIIRDIMKSPVLAVELSSMIEFQKYNLPIVEEMER